MPGPTRPGTPCGITPRFRGLAPTAGQIAHVFLTRPPRETAEAAPVRLACIRHAASVDPEPGSNSPPCLPAGAITGPPGLCVSWLLTRTPPAPPKGPTRCPGTSRDRRGQAPRTTTRSVLLRLPHTTTPPANPTTPPPPKSCPPASSCAPDPQRSACATC
jgi:hypothetical protein